MKKFTQTFFFPLFLCSTFFISSCVDTHPTPTFGVFAYKNDSTAIMNGVIGRKTPKDWEEYFAANPHTTTIIMENCPGSKNDNANLEAARGVRNNNIAIHLPAHAEIASGAVDFFLAGTTRTRESGSRIGVHAWASGGQEAGDFPVGHANHQPYINYYVEMGFTQQEAEGFYYFTINAAPAADVHWMTDEEIPKFQLLTP